MPHSIGEPSFNSLHDMICCIKANASSVPCTLDSGPHGYVGVLLSPTTYASLLGIPFDLHLHPSPLNIPQGSTQYVIAHLKNPTRIIWPFFKIPTDVESIN